MTKQNKHTNEKYLPDQSTRDYRTNPRKGFEACEEQYKGRYVETCVGRTKQSEAEACDINNIMKTYECTGLLPNSDGRQPTYDDFSTMETFQEALAIVSSANSRFAQLPAEIRAKFQNDPSQFLQYVEQASTNYEVARDLQKMGLIVEVPKTVDHNLEALKRIDENTRKAKASAASNTKDDTE